MTEIRCVKCDRLLMKVTGHRIDKQQHDDVPLVYKAEVKCPKCNCLHIYPLGGGQFVQTMTQTPFESGGTIRIIP